MTMSNLERPLPIMVPTIALYHSGVGAMVSSLFSLSYRHVSFVVVFFCLFLLFFLSLPLSSSLIGCRDHAYCSLQLQFSFFLACYNVNRFVASSLFCMRLQLNSYIAVFYLI